MTVIKKSPILCSMDGMSPKLVLATHELEWRNSVSGFRGHLAKVVRYSIKPNGISCELSLHLGVPTISSKAEPNLSWLSRLSPKLFKTVASLCVHCKLSCYSSNEKKVAQSHRSAKKQGIVLFRAILLTIFHKLC